MKRSAMFLGLLLVLSIPAPAHALREVVVGNQPLGPGFGFGQELLTAVNTAEWVYLYSAGRGDHGNLFFFFKGGPKALNEAMRRFAAIPARRDFEGHGPLRSGGEQCVTGVGFWPDGKTLVSGSQDKTLKLWGVEKGELVRNLKGNKAPVTVLAFSRDGKLFATAGTVREKGKEGKSMEVLLWDMKTTKPIKSFPEQTVPVNSLAFSPDGSTLAIGAGAGFNSKVNTETGRAKTPGEFKLWKLNQPEVELEIKPVPPAPKDDPAAKLVEQLGAQKFADREAAQKALRELGVKANPALRAGLKSEDPEVRGRSARVLAEIRNDALAAFVKGFDPAKAEQPDHQVWKRYVAIAGDSKASRELFARIIANEKWLRTLDDAEADPKSAGHVYRVGIAEMFRDFHNDPAKSPAWPCDRPEEVAYLLLLGSYPDDNPPAKLTGDEVVPPNLRGTAFLGRGIIFGEGQILHANGLSLGLDGKIRFFNAPQIVGAVGTDRVFAKLFAAWLVRRDPAAEVVRRGFQIASGRRVPELLPLARRYAANDFEPKRAIPPLATITALVVVAQLGTRADLPLFERHFGDETNVAAVDKPREDGARDYPRPAPVTDSTQLRDVALGLALLVHRANPEDFGFVVRKDTFKQKDGRYTIPWSTQLHLGFDSEASRTTAFKKAKAWLAEQKPKVEPPAAHKPDPESE